MDRRNFVRGAAAIPLAAGLKHFEVAARGSVNHTEARDNHALDLNSAPMLERYERTLRRVLSGSSPAYTEEFLLADVKPQAERRFTEYSGDLSGRYIGALATAAKVYGTDFPSLNPLVEKTIALQKQDGFFGSGFNYTKPTDQDLALLWGNGRLLVGLLEYNRLKPSAEVLAVCKRLGDFLVRIGPLMLSREMRDAFGVKHFASSYICWMQQTEGLAGLYLVTKDERYRRLAEEIAAVIERRPGDHVHGYLTSIRGVMDLYSATDDAKFLRQSEAAWHEVAQSKDLLITGGVPEGWSPNNHRTEGCGEADWVRLSLALWKETGKQEYLSAAEKAIFNELGFNQFATGDFGHRLYSETGLPENGAARAWWCCTLHGLRCFPDIHASVFSSKDEDVKYDLPLDGWIDTAGFSAIAGSSIAKDGGALIKVTAAGKEPVRLAIRIPSAVEGVQCKLNGAALQRTSEGDRRYFTMKRAWSAGDTIEIAYAMKLQSVASGNDRVAYWFGPWLLGAPAADNPEYFNELTAENRLVTGEESALAIGRQPARQFSVPIAATMVTAIHAEYPDQPSKVLLRAVAEQTGMPTTSWELRFLTK
jgi:DUF1680 family protein